MSKDSTRNDTERNTEHTVNMSSYFSKDVTVHDSLTESPSAETAIQTVIQD